MSTVVKPPCVVCKTPSITRCSRCKINHYCSEKCQRKDWPSHKLACVPAKAPTVTSNAASNATNTSTNTSTSSASSTNKTTSTPASTAKTPKLPDPSQPLNLRAVDMSGYKKSEPSRTCTDLKFQYQPSADGVDENLVIFFHGLGDKIEPSFTRLAASMQLPMTATCCVQAPMAVPYLEEEGWTWYPSFNNLTGECTSKSAWQKGNNTKGNDKTSTLYSHISIFLLVLFPHIFLLQYSVQTVPSACCKSSKRSGLTWSVW